MERSRNLDGNSRRSRCLEHNRNTTRPLRFDPLPRNEWLRANRSQIVATVENCDVSCEEHGCSSHASSRLRCKFGEKLARQEFECNVAFVAVTRREDESPDTRQRIACDGAAARLNPHGWQQRQRDRLRVGGCQRLVAITSDSAAARWLLDASGCRSSSNGVSTRWNDRDALAESTLEFLRESLWIDWRDGTRASCFR